MYKEPLRSRCRRLTGLTAIRTSVLVIATGTVLAAPPLPNLGASREALTVSGLSSGAYMAVQLQIAHSATFKGAGIVAGGPYYCAEGQVSRALVNCMSPSPKAQPPSSDQQALIVNELAKTGKIDHPEHLRNQRVWMFSGGNDRTVERSVMDALDGFYKKQLPPASIRYVKNPDAGHAMISVAESKPNTCASSETPYINQCQQFDAAGDLLDHLVGPLNPRSRIPQGELLSFDQRPFVTGKAVDASLADEGHAYVPKSCRNGECRIHVALHGCRQNTGTIGMRFVEGAGYNAWADSNRLIILYPQTVSRSGLAFGSWKFMFNPKGCWDWWGYTGNGYHTRDGVQIQAIMGMVAQLVKPVSR